MIIKRIEVEEGFLDGLDLSFSSGLNVLIGPRGAGKTSIIELLRYCLGAKSFTDKSATFDHAKAILGSGKVTTTLETDGEIIRVSRGTGKDSWKTSGSFDTPLIFSQNEIELLALHERGRLRLIDGFHEEEDEESELQQITQEIRVLLSEMESTKEDLDDVTESLSELEGTEAEYAALIEEEKEFQQSIEGAKDEQKELEELVRRLAATSTQKSVVERGFTALSKWAGRIEELITVPPEIQPWPTSAGGTDLLAEARTTMQKSIANLKVIVSRLDASKQILSESLASLSADSLEKEDRARELRRYFESLKEGAGDLAKQVAAAKEQMSHRKELDERRQSLIKKLQKLQEQRRKLLDRMESWSNKRYEERTKVAQKLNHELKPRIKVFIDRAALHEDYVNALTAALRGSGLHYNTLAPQIASNMSPREFVEAIELGDAARIAEIVDIPESRAAKLQTQISREDLEKILLVSIDDSVRLCLLDGKDFKSTENLSTGQRCTVILPILLGTEALPLIVDQPEDHLDNAFIVDTLIRAISRRKSTGQIIFSTHNANIPVLGEAELVVLLGSDGERGFVRHQGKLNDSNSVEAISTVMEGGREAFQRRADFYEAQAEDEGEDEEPEEEDDQDEERGSEDEDEWPF